MRAADSLRVWLPRWWRGEVENPATAMLGLVLSPAEGMFRAAVAVRNGAYDRGLLTSHPQRVPVISIGNLTVGGTGKTPLGAWVAAWLVAKGRAPAVVLRGYGADEIEVHRELNPTVPVVAAAKRSEAIEAAVEGGADCVVMDDGFQHRSVRRDLDVVLLAAERWAEPRRLLPRGPWREPLEALSRADFIVVTRKSATVEEAGAVLEALADLGFAAGKGIAHLAAVGLETLERPGVSAGTLEDLAGESVLAVTTLADPEPFIAGIRAAGARVETLVFPDHHSFSDAEVRMIGARAAGRPVLVTRKEAVKLRAAWPAELTGFVVGQEVRIEMGSEQLEAALMRAIGERE